MPRPQRAAAGGLLYHVSNTAAGRKRFFRDSADYAAFIRAIAAAKAAVGMRVIGYCLMPDHFHLVLLPRKDGDLSRFMLRLATAHLRHNRDRHHVQPGEKLYASRFKSFPIQSDDHLLGVLRYVESNSVRAYLAKRAGQWAWSSLKTRGGQDTVVDVSPVQIPRDWERVVAEPLGGALEEIRTCHQRGRPYGLPAWTRKTADRLGLSSSLRPRGRPRKVPTPVAVKAKATRGKARRK